ncbi:MAG: phosphatidate cytidylyltransferase, partial [Proteobacteria bacterium]|nr:phosphatidate cytidylyltransferase [Pseudomonadota bacterium]
IKFDKIGLIGLCFLGSALGVRELIRILFAWDDSHLLKVIFAISALAIFCMTLLLPEHSILGFSVLSIIFCSSAILYEKKFDDLTHLSLFQAKSILGFFYVGLLPALVARVLNLEQGEVWFFMMFAMVFAGDTFAYIFGLLFGKKKILPNISPKKTIVGSISGLIGSALASVPFWSYLPQIPPWYFLVLAVFTGLIAQLGDLFESMLKRVANVKDSGRLMPGHGGILDRIDGVLFGAPILLAGALIAQSLF